MAQQVRRDTFGPLRALLGAARGSLHMVGYGLLLAGVMLLFGLPMLFMVVWAAAQDVTLAKLLLVAGLTGWAWVWLYLFFVPEAVFVSQVGPLQAVKHSVAVVRTSFWPAAMLMVLTTVILLGMARVWMLSASALQAPWGVGLAILGHAYIASGLLAAAMAFYRERHQAIQSGLVVAQPERWA
jgi:hypothetical protein